MMRHKGGSVHPRRLRPLVLGYYFLSTLLFCLVISVFAVFVANRVVQERVRAQYTEAMRSVALQMERELCGIRDVADYLYVNRDVKRIIQHYNARDYTYVRAVDALDALLSQNMLSNVFSNLNAIVIFSNERNIYQFVEDNHYRRFDMPSIVGSENYARAIRENRMIISRQAESSLYSPKNEHTFSVFRSILDEGYQSVIGGVFLSFRIDTMTNHMLAGGVDYLTTDLLDAQGRSMTDAAADPSDGVAAWLVTAPQTAEITTFEDGERIYFRYPLPDFECYTIGSLPKVQFNAERSMLLSISLAALIISASLSLVIWRFLNKRVLKPLSLITRSLKQASKGAFEPLKQPPCGVEEIDSLTRNYNRAIVQIDTLLETLVEERTTYKELEYKALQSQISSHFITNTLNAVRWLAILQKADNIKQIVDAFSRLLKSTWKGMNMDSTLGQELDNVKDYIYLQQITHSYKCELHYDVDESMLNVRCIKFILQPLMENAFFHGIAPKEGTGTICVGIHAAEAEGAPAVRLTVRDDGVGMPPERIAEVLEGGHSSNRFNGIGVSNINERLKMRYGAAYGVTLESVPGSYTLATVLTPRLEEGEQNDPCIDR